MSVKAKQQHMEKEILFKNQLTSCSIAWHTFKSTSIWTQNRYSEVNRIAHSTRHTDIQYKMQEHYQNEE